MGCALLMLGVLQDAIRAMANNRPVHDRIDFSLFIGSWAIGYGLEGRMFDRGFASSEQEIAALLARHLGRSCAIQFSHLTFPYIPSLPLT